jgi:hypothetical protein
VDAYAWLSTIVAIVALIAAAYTVIYSRSQLRYSAIALPAQLILQVDQVFLTYPLLRPYFYDSISAPAAEVDAETHHRVYAVAQFYIDVLEYCWAGAGHYTKRAQVSYQEWVHDIFAGSPTVRELYLANQDWYPGLKRLRDTGRCVQASGHEFFTR